LHTWAEAEPKMEIAVDAIYGIQAFDLLSEDKEKCGVYLKC